MLLFPISETFTSNVYSNIMSVADAMHSLQRRIEIKKKQEPLLTHCILNAGIVILFRSSLYQLNFHVSIVIKRAWLQYDRVQNLISDTME